MNDLERYALEVAIKRGLIADTGGLKAHLFDKQRAFKDDPSHFKLAQCSRRAGKTEMAAELLFESAMMYPNTTSLYVALTRTSAKNIMWPKLISLRDKYKIGCELLEGTLEVKLPNKSRVWLVGADMSNFIDRLRGGAYPRSVLDEVQAFRSHIKELIDDVLTPAVMDFNGSIYLLGTPGPLPNGYFYEASELGMHGFSVHKWSIYDNPHMPNAPAFIDAVIKRNNWTRDNPTFRREYLNEWVIDRDALFYKFTRDNVCRSSELGSGYHRVLGIDYGFNDKTTFAILTYSDYSPKIFVEYTEGASEMIPSEIASRVSQLVAKFQPEKIVADTGGLGKSITEEMIRRYSLPIEAAEKTDKYSWASLLNGDFIDKNVFVFDQNVDLINQYETLTKHESDKSKEDPTLPNDFCDAVLYAYRYIKAYHFTPRPEPKTLNQIYQEEEDAIWETDERYTQELKEKEWWEK